MIFNKKEDRIPESKKQELFARIRPIIAKQLGIDEAKITLQSKLNEDLGADSLDSVQVIMALEEEFGIEILDEDAEKIKTIEDIVRYLTDREKNDKTPSGG